MSESVKKPGMGGKWFTEMSMGKNITNYDSMLVLTHFKGHTMGGFGGSNKNIGILASTDILVIDQASVDLIYALSRTTARPWWSAWKPGTACAS